MVRNMVQVQEPIQFDRLCSGSHKQRVEAPFHRECYIHPRHLRGNVVMVVAPEVALAVGESCEGVRSKVALALVGHEGESALGRY